ncbi:putative leader peptide [Streptomyces avermitilis]|uniref:putative leader peptide n=1 Tax=Streptomyces avermitilis TaxID=33903 RepID=UPI0033D92986
MTVAPRRAPGAAVHLGPFAVGTHGHREVHIVTVSLTGLCRRGVLRIVTDTCVRLWRRVHMDLVRYAGCVCRPSS